VYGMPKWKILLKLSFTINITKVPQKIYFLRVISPFFI